MDPRFIQEKTTPLGAASITETTRFIDDRRNIQTRTSWFSRLRRNSPSTLTIVRNRGIFLSIEYSSTTYPKTMSSRASLVRSSTEFSMDTTRRYSLTDRPEAERPTRSPASRVSTRSVEFYRELCNTFLISFEGIPRTCTPWRSPTSRYTTRTGTICCSNESSAKLLGDSRIYRA